VRGDFSHSGDWLLLYISSPTDCSVHGAFREEQGNRRRQIQRRTFTAIGRSHYSKTSSSKLKTGRLDLACWASFKPAHGSSSTIE
jgi:hypothetical protein